MFLQQKRHQKLALEILQKYKSTENAAISITYNTKIAESHII